MDTGLSPIVIVKLGGSLLDLPDVSERIVALLAQRPAIRPVLIAGGGAAADVVRDWGKTFALSESDCHALALMSLQLTASLLDRILPRSRLISSAAEATSCWSQCEWPILDVSAWLNESEANGAGLPESWAVTSDSLSAWVADKWCADELWLLKSADLPAETNFATARQAGLVDAFFPQIADRIPQICWCNLRAEPLRLRTWQIRL